MPCWGFPRHFLCTTFLRNRTEFPQMSANDTEPSGSLFATYV